MKKYQIYQHSVEHLGSVENNRRRLEHEILSADGNLFAETDDFEKAKKLLDEATEPLHEEQGYAGIFSRIATAELYDTINDEFVEL